MSNRGNRAITQDELVGELCKRGYSRITTRTLTDWRQNGVLPPFDIAGPGRGKGRGRSFSSWSQRELVINQAQWVEHLLTIYRMFEDCHVPLWMLGYPVPLERVRRSLYAPLHELMVQLEAEASTPGNLEDTIDDAIFSYCARINKGESEFLQVPKESIEAILNVVFNCEYDVTVINFKKA